MLGLGSLALFLALKRTKLPHLTPILDEQGVAVDFELDTNVSHSDLLKDAKLPLLLSFVQFTPETAFALDPSLQEQSLAYSHIVVAMDEDQKLCGVRKMEGGGFTPTFLSNVLTTSSEVSSPIFSSLYDHLKQREEEENAQDKATFDSLPLQTLGFLL